MNSQVLIQAACRFDVDAQVPTAVLKRYLHQTCGVDARRLSRLSMLTLAGALQAPIRANIHPDAAIYLASGFSSPSVFSDMLANVLQHQTARPFDFLAHLHNAPAFHLAATLGCHGATVFQVISSHAQSWVQPLQLAVNHILAGGHQALVGWCCEHQPASAHADEGSLWLMLRRSQTDDEALPFLRLEPADSLLNLPVCADDKADYFHKAADLLETLAHGNTTVILPCGADWVLRLCTRSALAVSAQTAA